MKRWTLITLIETDDDLTKRDILTKIDQELNRGDGLYVSIKEEDCNLSFEGYVKDKD